jgi:hypothetical protein
MAPPSGLDSLQVREAYFRERRSCHFGDWALSAGWVTLGAIVSWLFIAGFSGLLH